MYNFLASGNPILSVNLSAQSVGVNEEVPSGKFHVNANNSSSFPHLVLEETDANDYARIKFQHGSGSTNW